MRDGQSDESRGEFVPSKGRQQAGKEDDEVTHGLEAHGQPPVQNGSQF